MNKVLCRGGFKSMLDLCSGEPMHRSLVNALKMLQTIMVHQCFHYYFFAAKLLCIKYVMDLVGVSPGVRMNGWGSSGDIGVQQVLYLMVSFC